MEKNSNSLFIAQNELEESLLRSAMLILNGGKGKRADQFSRAILAVVIYGTPHGGYDVKNVTSVFNAKFHLDEDEQNIQHQINILIRDGYVKPTDNGTYVENDESKKGQKFFEDLGNRTNALLNGIVAKVRNKHTLSERQVATIINNTKVALSAFFQMNALAMFGLQDKESPKDNDAIVKLLTKNIDAHIGKILVGVLAYTIDMPNDEEYIVLEQWAKAVVAMRSTNIDPMLRNFKQQQIAHKKFILDTDVLLNLLCRNARYSDSYRKMVSLLVDVGCNVLVPEFVIKEVGQHAETAKHKFSAQGKQYIEYTDELLEGPKSNVFIEDYVKTIRKEPKRKGMEFSTYLGNIYSDQTNYVIKENIKKLIGTKNAETPYPLQENVLDEEKANALKEKIKERAMDTPKGWGRTIEQLEEGALNDTRLYLTVRNENVGTETKGLLGYQSYLLTRSTRTIACATELELYDKHVVCHPNSLISILEDIGQLGEIDVINLFDNPFLAYTAELIWDQVDPLIQAGAQIGHSDFIQLRAKYDLQINEILTEDMAKRQKLAEKYYKEGILFAKDWHELFEEKQKVKVELEETKEEVQKLKLDKNKLEKDNEKLKREQHYLKRLVKGGKAGKSKLEKLTKVVRRKKH